MSDRGEWCDKPIETYHASGQLEDEIYTAGLLNGLSVARSFDGLSRLGSLSALLGSPQLGGGGSGPTRLEFPGACYHAINRGM